MGRVRGGTRNLGIFGEKWVMPEKVRRNFDFLDQKVGCA